MNIENHIVSVFEKCNLYLTVQEEKRYSHNQYTFIFSATVWLIPYIYICLRYKAKLLPLLCGVGESEFVTTSLASKMLSNCFNLLECFMVRMSFRRKINYTFLITLNINFFIK